MVEMLLNNPMLIVLAVVVLLVVIILFSGYVKASPDQALLISGLRKKPKVLIGKSGVKIPFLERKDQLNLQLIPIDVKTSSAVPTADYINIQVDAAVNVKISSDEERLKLAAMNFLNKKTEYIQGVAREVLEGNMREIVGKMALEEMVSDRQKFATLVKENAEPDLAAMGLDIISFNVQNFVDENGVIENLGVDNIVKIQKNAAISRAESEKEIAMAQAQAKREAKEAEVTAETVIAEKNNELLIRQAELKQEADTKKAEADAAYRIQEETQRKEIETVTVNADIARSEREATLKEREAQVKEQELNATVRKEADAAKYRKEKEAEAVKIQRERDAEAKLFEIQKEAEAQKAQAEAKLYEAEKQAEMIKVKSEADRVSRENEAMGIAAVGKAEAEAIKAKGEAEAEAMEKKADAYAKYNGAAVMEMVVGILPKMAEEISKSVTSIDKVSIIESGNGDGVSSVGGWTPGILQKTIESVKEATGFDLLKVMEAGTIDAKVNRNLNISGLSKSDDADSAADELVDTLVSKQQSE